MAATPFHAWVFPDGTLWANFYRNDDGYLLRFPSLADFTVSMNGTKVSAYPAPGVSPQTVEHLYLNQVLPLALSRQWKLVFHGAAVELGDAAVAFLGVSGRGKSTLAASFATAGYRFLTDDGLQLEKDGVDYLIQPSHPSIRLWDDARLALIPNATSAAAPLDYTAKARLLADQAVVHCAAPRRLRCMYFLGAGNFDSITIEPIAGRAAMIELVKHSFLLDIEERQMLTHQFSQLAALASLPLFFQLDYPRRFDRLAEVRAAVARHFDGYNQERAG